MRKIIIITIALLCCLTMAAGPVTESEAREKAAQFVFSKKGDASATRGVYRFGSSGGTGATLTVGEAQKAFYVFNIDSDGGYVIVSGDDRMPDVLGYSYSGTFMPDKIPANMRAWLDGYAEQYEYLQANSGAQAVTRTSVLGERIEPLLVTHWKQNAPYNDKCPKIHGESTLTGCVATAMAQVMYYHQWPKRTTKEIPGFTYYYEDSEGKEEEIEVPAVGVTEIDWDNMLPSYKDDAGTSAERDAVATLMLLCGNSVEMTYGIDGSSASINYARMVLPEYFDYDGFSIGYVNRSGYDNADWNQLMYDELSNNGPVLYKGNSKQYGGHAFVIDGYDADDYFHVNWGWGGNDDGYFLLDALKDYNKTQGPS